MRYFPLFLITLIAISLFTACRETEKQTPAELAILSTLSKKDLEIGQHLFKLQCARCHGITGSGGNAPSLKRLNLKHAPDDASLVKVIQIGISGTEMPGTWLLTTPDIKLVAGYVRSLSEVTNTVIKGNLALGKTIYEEKSACNTCHIIDGKGGSLGPELSRVGAKRSAEFIKQSLLKPGFYKKEGGLTNSNDGFITNLVYEIETKEGRKISGIRINEDAFTLQLRDAQNRFHSFQKRDLVKMDKAFGKSLMPSVKNVLKEEEIDDLVAYLVSLK